MYRLFISILAFIGLVRCALGSTDSQVLAPQGGVLKSLSRSAMASCTGVTAATISASQFSICPVDTVSINSTWSGATTGMTHQWQMSTDGTSTWVRVGGADTLATLELPGTTLLGGPVQLRLMTTCTTGGTSVYSNVLSFNKGTVARCSCQQLCGNPNPCTGNILRSFGSPGRGYALGLPNTCVGNCLSFSALTDTLRLTAGSQLDLAFTSGSMVLDYSLWLDFDRDSMLAPQEWKNLGTGVSAAASRSVSITIPPTAANGVTNARIVATYLPNANTPKAFCTGNSSFMGYVYTFPVKVSGGITSLSTASTRDLALYPNPTNGKLIVQGLDEQSDALIYISDLMGRTVEAPILLPAGTHELRVEKAPGLYLFKVVQAGRVHVQRVLVQ